MAVANITWGEERTAHELLVKLGIRVSPRTVRKYIPIRDDGSPDRRNASHRWATFVRNHAKAVVAASPLSLGTCEGNSKLPRCPLANERDVVRGFDVEDGPFAGDDRRSTIMDLLAIVEHEVNNACCPGRFDPVSLEGPSTGSLPSNIVSRISNFFWCAIHGAQRHGMAL